MECMVTLAFDTLKAAKALREAGFEEAQAEARTGLQAHVGAVRADVAALEARLFRHLWLMAVGIVGVTVTLVKLIP